MNEQENKNKKKSPRQLRFYENPYDIETFLESFNVASNHNKELIFIDRFLSHIRLDPCKEVATVCYEVLRDLGIIKME